MVRPLERGATPLKAHAYNNSLPVPIEHRQGYRNRNGVETMTASVKFKKGIGQDPKTGSWWIRIRVNNREIRATFSTRVLAENALNALRQQKKAAQLGLATVEPAETLQSLTTRYIEDAQARGLSDATITDYKAVSKRLVNHFGKRHHPRIQQHEVLQYVKARRQAGAGARLITRELKLLQTFIKSTVGVSFLTWSVPKLVQDKTQKPNRSDSEIVDVYRIMADRPDVQRAILTALLTALRPSDVHSLSSSDLVDGVLLVGMQKRRGSPIAIPVVATLATAFENISGTLVASAGATKAAFQRSLIGWHGVGHLRATAATWASEAGFPDEEIDVLLGHSQWTLARRHYIRSTRLVLADPNLELRRKMLEAVEKRWLASLKLPT